MDLDGDKNEDLEGRKQKKEEQIGWKWRLKKVYDEQLQTGDGCGGLNRSRESRTGRSTRGGEVGRRRRRSIRRRKKKKRGRRRRNRTSADDDWTGDVLMHKFHRPKQATIQLHVHVTYMYLRTVACLLTRGFSDDKAVHGSNNHNKSLESGSCETKPRYLNKPPGQSRSRLGDGFDSLLHGIPHTMHNMQDSNAIESNKD